MPTKKLKKIKPRKKSPHKLQLVKLKDNSQGFYPTSMYNHPFVLLGEIEQMPGHGVFVAIGTHAAIYSGYHIDDFETVKSQPMVL